MSFKLIQIRSQYIYGRGDETWGSADEWKEAGLITLPQATRLPGMRSAALLVESINRVFMFVTKEMQGR